MKTTTLTGSRSSATDSISVPKASPDNQPLLVGRILCKKQPRRFCTQASAAIRSLFGKQAAFPHLGTSYQRTTHPQTGIQPEAPSQRESLPRLGTNHPFRFLSRVAVALCLLLLPLAVAAQQADSLRVLWIGNSYTYFNDLPKMVQQIAQTNGMKLSFVSSTVGGAELAGHVKRPELKQQLAQGGWDYVVIQEQSANPAKPTQRVLTDVYPYAKQLAEMIRKDSPQAHLVFYMTWGHKYGNLEGVEGYPLDDTYEGMQERIKTTYLEMAYQNDAWCAPVGMAWKQVRAERPDLVLYNQDQSHPSLVGSYLAANVIFTTLYQKPYQTDFRPEEALDACTAEYLQQIAQKTVLGNLKLLNIEK